MMGPSKTLVLAGLILGHLRLFVSYGHHVAEDPLSSAKEIGRANHRITMLFPLIIAIAARLAALVPTFFLGLIGILVFVALSKKAFIISVIAFLIAYSEKQRNQRPKIIHIHHPATIQTFDFDHAYENPHHYHKHHHPWKHWKLKHHNIFDGGRRTGILPSETMFYPSHYLFENLSEPSTTNFTTIDRVLPEEDPR